MEKFIYGLDLSLSCTGIAIFDLTGNSKYIGSVATNEKDTTGKRLKSIAEFMLDLREKFVPNTIVIERAFSSRYYNAIAALYRVHGAINLLFWDIEQIYYTPKTIKAIILKGNSTKKQIQEKILEKYAVNFNNEDESDAFSCGLSYFIKNGIILNWK